MTFKELKQAPQHEGKANQNISMTLEDALSAINDQS